MKFGVSLPTIGPLATRENLIRVAQEAETLGFDSCVVSDHIAMPDRVESYYAYGDTDPDVETGVYPYGLDQIRLDGIAALLFVAACTERVQLASAVIILGLRPPHPDRQTLGHPGQPLPRPCHPRRRRWLDAGRVRSARHALRPPRRPRR